MTIILSNKSFEVVLYKMDWYEHFLLLQHDSNQNCY